MEQNEAIITQYNLSAGKEIIFLIYKYNVSYWSNSIPQLEKKPKNWNIPILPIYYKESKRDLSAVQEEMKISKRKVICYS